MSSGPDDPQYPRRMLNYAFETEKEKQMRLSLERIRTLCDCGYDKSHTVTMIGRIAQETLC